ncbi:hypothetical protein ADK75_07400 [Streptomyces virginiae]|uniref:Uncharacterized protein n=1 Tax=Streptomyces virginiae TaxID=1961 RepID=A0A0L8N1T7_STRVG|nr:hypothetical protein ADK75_07400 [Streptomyces virginiae]
MGGGGGCISDGNRFRQAELGSAQGGLPRGGFDFTVSAAVAGEDGGDLGAGEIRRCCWSGCFDQQFQSVSAVLVSVRSA